MDIGLVTEREVRSALESLRRAGSLSGNPLLAMDALRRRLADEGLTDGEAAREWALAALLEETVEERLAELRRQRALGGAQRTPSVERELLQADFRQQSVEREAWSCLYFRYFSPLRMQVQDLAAVAHAGARDPSRYVRRRMGYGYTLLAGVLRDREHGALRRRSRPEGGVAPAPAGPTDRAAVESAGTLGASLTRFIGRERELAEVERLLGENRLLTLTGPGGCGKTRLALRLAAQLAARFEGGARLVELGEVSDPSLVAQAVAAVVGLREQRGRSVADALVEVLRPQDLLLVLDNCEQVLEPSAALAGLLLRHCPSLRILATSREAMGLAGEVVWLVPPLALPDAGYGADPGAIAGSESVQLFVDRARLARSSFALSAENAAAVAELCRRVDGIPLAIELAAARVSVLSAAQIAARLDDSLRLLSSGGRAGPARQQTLRATLGWSYDLLAPAEQEVWARLSVFRGGCSLEAAEAVVSDEEVPAADVLDLVAGLVSKSLVVLDDQTEPPRYRQLDTVRAYGRERLEASGRERELRDRHLAWAVALAEQAVADLRRRPRPAGRVSWPRSSGTTPRPAPTSKTASPAGARWAKPGASRPS
jgi:predicted ATPase